MIHTVIIAPALASRAGLRAILSANGDFEIVSEAASTDALGVINAPIDICLIQVAPEENLYLPESIFNSDTSPGVLALTDTPSSASVLMEADLRAFGILPSNCTEEELIAALYAIEIGLTVGDAAMLSDLITKPKAVPKNGGDLIELTDREMDVLTLLADGFANKQISVALGISEHTVKFHVSSVYNKLDVSNRAEAVRQGIQMGLIVI